MTVAEPTSRGLGHTSLNSQPTILTEIDSDNPRNHSTTFEQSGMKMRVLGGGRIVRTAMDDFCGSRGA